jgi:hypothetical protein
MKTTLLILALAATPAFAATPCDGIWQKPLADGRALLKATPIKGLPAKPKVYDLMQNGKWSIVWAQFPDAEPGGYFIRDGRYVDVWGGVAAGESANDIAKWAQKLGKDMPKPLAACFGWYVVDGRETPAAWPNPFKG